MMKLLLTVLLGGVVACGGHNPPQTSPTPSRSQGLGAASPREAVDLFFASVRSQDLQAMSLVWGTVKGPARDNMERTELEKREILLQCYFTNDSYLITDETQPSEGRRMFHVELTRGQVKRSPAVFTVRGPAGRWYVENLEIAVVRDFCTGTSIRK